MDKYDAAKDIRKAGNIIMLIGFVLAFGLIIAFITDVNFVLMGIAVGVLGISIWQRMLLAGIGEMIKQTTAIAEQTQKINQISSQITHLEYEISKLSQSADK